MDKYEEALAKARAGKSLEEIFPELKESEDEMIRRTLVEYFGPGVQLDFVRGVPIQKIRDWLEKQKEQKPAEWSEEDKNIYNKALDAIYYKDLNDKYEVVDALEALCDLISRKRKVIPPYARWMPSDEQMGMLLAVINDPNNAGAESCHLMLQSLYSDLQKLL